ENAEKFIAASRMVVEGYMTTKTVYLLSQKMGVVMPITAEIYKVLYEGQKIEDALESLMGRNKKHEMEDLMIK
ncbi:MAG TPA: glycerol-3-phosphate dehydrogenase, partial [Firmicutes bacterium]|nr:glycerol-3-phosphate dehydrogenase [Bacillota bacterium]